MTPHLLCYGRLPTVSGMMCGHKWWSFLLDRECSDNLLVFAYTNVVECQVGRPCITVSGSTGIYGINMLWCILKLASFFGGSNLSFSDPEHMLSQFASNLSSGEFSNMTVHLYMWMMVKWRWYDLQAHSFWEGVSFSCDILCQGQQATQARPYQAILTCLTLAWSLELPKAVIVSIETDKREAIVVVTLVLAEALSNACYRLPSATHYDLQ